MTIQNIIKKAHHSWWAFLFSEIGKNKTLKDFLSGDSLVSPRRDRIFEALDKELGKINVVILEEHQEYYSVYAAEGVAFQRDSNRLDKVLHKAMYTKKSVDLKYNKDVLLLKSGLINGLKEHYSKDIQEAFIQLQKNILLKVLQHSKPVIILFKGSYIATTNKPLSLNKYVKNSLHLGDVPNTDKHTYFAEIDESYSTEYLRDILDSVNIVLKKKGKPKINW